MLRHLPPRLHETSQSRVFVQHPGRLSLESPPLLLLEVERGRQCSVCLEEESDKKMKKITKRDKTPLYIARVER